jgi:CHAD domain-containing protein
MEAGKWCRRRFDGGRDKATDHDGPALDAGTTAEQAAPVILTAGAREFAHFLAVMLESDDPEGPHKSRVALRRLRAALVAFRPIIAPDLARVLKRRLKYYFRVIGQVRDADVLVHDLAGVGDPDALQSEAARVRRKVRKKLRARKADRLVGFVDKRFGGKDWRHRTAAAKRLRHAPVTRLAAAALHRSWAECLSHGADLSRLTETERHELRKALKTFRYLCEHFAGLWPEESVRPFQEKLRDLQDDLGRLNDLAMARARGLAVADASAGPTLERAAAAWAALAASARWWG